MTHEDQVQAMASMLKLTPIYASIQQFKQNQHIFESIAHLNPLGAPYVPGNKRVDEHENKPMEREQADMEVM